MKAYPLITAIIPTYNRAAEVCRAIDSVLAQTYRNIEVIVVDDGSTDDTQVRLQAYAGRVRVVKQTNAGPGAARNHGVRLSSGDIVAFLDSDDVWLPPKLERQNSIMQRAGGTIPCCLCNAIFRFTDGTEMASFDRAGFSPRYGDGIWENVTEVLLNSFVLFNQTAAIRRDVFERLGGFDETFWCLEDHDLALRLSLEGGWGYTTEPLVIWLEGADGSLYKKAMQDEVALSTAWLKIHEKFRELVEKRKASHTLLHRVERELRHSQRQLKTAKLAESSRSKTASARVSFLKGAERVRKALQRRSPWFPTMRVRELEIQPVFSVSAR
jgi:glycosyltransferase involved in cell wall biosynthesis